MHSRGLCKSSILWVLMRRNCATGQRKDFMTWKQTSCIVESRLFPQFYGSDTTPKSFMLFWVHTSPNFSEYSSFPEIRKWFMRCGLLHERKQNQPLCGPVKFLCHLSGVGYRRRRWRGLAALPCWGSAAPNTCDIVGYLWACLGLDSLSYTLVGEDLQAECRSPH